MSVERSMLVTTSAGLTTALAGLRDAAVVGIDVERADADNYWRHPALIQVGADDTVALIDPLALPDLSELGGFAASRTVVLHALENDVTPLAAVGVELRAVEDTAIAAAMLGLPTGLATLLDDLLGVVLDGDKQRMQRADWARRPLSDEMLAYAAGDVADLPRLWSELASRLTAAGRYDWYVQERDAVRALPPVEQRRTWTRLRGLGRLDRATRTRARVLWEAREALARDTDTAPGRVLTDRALLDVAAAPVTEVAELRSKGMRRQSARRFGTALLAALHSAQDADLVPARARRFDDRQRELIDELRERRSHLAGLLGIDAGVLCPNRALEQAVAARPTAAAALRTALDLRPWQWEQVADTLLEALDLPRPGTSAFGDTHSTKDPAMADVLNPDALHHEVDRLDGWEGTTKDGISKQYTFDDFAGSIAFVNRVAEQAERAGHHPDLAISWDTVTVTYVTHSAGGVTAADIEQARTVDGLPS